jgi:hypothetical protein
MKPRTVAAKGNQKSDWRMASLEINVVASWHCVSVPGAVATGSRDELDCNELRGVWITPFWLPI